MIESNKSVVYEHASEKDGNVFIRTLSPVKDPITGEVENITVISKDITERKRAEEALQKSREKLRNLTAYLQDVREEDRKNIAREIHDELGQALTVMKIDLSLLTENFSEDQKSLIEQTDSICTLIDDTLNRVKKISSELRPELLDDFGLISAIEWQALELINKAGITCELKLPEDKIDLDQDLSVAIFRIFQESLRNVIRHAKATKVQVSLKKVDRMLELIVKDNGIGIEEKDISSSTSLGLIGMQERVDFLGGDLEISGVRKKGTTVKVTVPVKNRRSR